MPRTPAAFSSSRVPRRVRLSLLVLAALLASGCAGSRRADRARNPVVFVHGWSSSPAAWATMTERFRADGWPDAYLVAWEYDSRRSNAETAARLAGRIDTLLAETGARRVDVVSHSMGALPTRYYARELDGARRIDAWVSLGGPSHGTVTAYTCFSAACREMRPGSAFLRALNDGDETPGGPRYATWRSPCDLVVVPQDSPALDGATNHVTACLLHLDLPENAGVYAQVRDWLAANEAGSAEATW